MFMLAFLKRLKGLCPPMTLFRNGMEALSFLLGVVIIDAPIALFGVLREA
jgi:hypothetical protein